MQDETSYEQNFLTQEADWLASSPDIHRDRLYGNWKTNYRHM